MIGMKLLIGALTVLGAGSMWQVHADYFGNIERYWTASPSNSYIFTENQSEPVQDIVIKKRIDIDDPLLLNPVVTSSGGKEMYSGNDLNICEKYDKTTWDYFAVSLFNRAMIPGPRRRKCPVSPQTHEITRFQYDKQITITDDIPVDKYEISYVVKSMTNEIVFSTLKFRFERSGGFDPWG